MFILILVFYLFSTESYSSGRFFSVVGAGGGAGNFKEIVYFTYLNNRMEEQAYTTEAPSTIANQWQRCPTQGFSRGHQNQQRCALMTSLQGHPLRDLKPPVINKRTRLAFFSDITSGDLHVQGLEKQGPVTKVFDLKKLKKAG